MVGIDPYDRVKQREAQQRKQLLLEQQQQRAAQQQQQRAQQQQLGNQDALLSLVRVHRRVQVLHVYVLILLSVPSLFPVQVNLSPSAPTVSGDLLLRRENDQMKDELRQANMVFREKNRRLDSIVSFHRCCLSCLVQQSCTAILYSNSVQPILRSQSWPKYLCPTFWYHRTYKLTETVLLVPGTFMLKSF